MADQTPAVRPGTTRGLRACMICSIVLEYKAFIQGGCPNCDFLDLIRSSESVNECTSAVFEGMIALNDPKTSWVAKWQRLQDYVPGVYAVKVVGTLNEDRIQDALEAGVQYIPRDGTSVEEYQASRAQAEE
ncbi:transcription elongation factor spt4 [Rhizodiscina lignyota]|uniref:Transcription elongation factor SPT4 n=1 Tax=Rhizodiscina lignyota TaxID=1504668 RepID=A0A9P4M5A9_9PEZI|nr:transcription elongation factor spt4 [Rhizodiscina lignyota]